MILKEMFDGIQNKKILEYRAYIMDTDAFEDDEIYGRCLDRVSGYRRSKVERLRRREDRKSSLAAGLLLSYALKEYAGIDEYSLDYTCNKSGKPFADTGNTAVQFSISHTEGCVAAVVGLDSCGIDVEKVRRIPDSIVNRMYSERDRRVIENGVHPEIYGTCVWTRREAYSKMTGTGILMNDEVQQLVMDDEYVEGLQVELGSYGVRKTASEKRMDMCGIVKPYDGETLLYDYIMSVCVNQAGKYPLRVKMIDSADIVCYHV